MRIYCSSPENRHRKGINRLGLTLAVIAIFCVVAVAVSCKSEPELYEDTYTVRRGDSLWSISGEFCPSNMNRQDWISMVKSRNGIGNIIRPGQKIIVFTAD